MSADRREPGLVFDSGPFLHPEQERICPSEPPENETVTAQPKLPAFRHWKQQVVPTGRRWWLLLRGISGVSCGGCCGVGTAAWSVENSWRE